MPRCVGVVLAGGAGTRSGAPAGAKGLLTVAGRRIVDRVVDALRESCDSILLSANAPDAADWLPGVGVVRDRQSRGGPATGIAAALEEARAPVLVVAWDMPFVPPALLAALRRAGEDGAPVVMPESAPGMLEPLCAYYAPPCLPVLRAWRGSGEPRGPRALATLPGARVMSSQAVRGFGEPAMMFLSVDTPADRERAELLAAAGI